MQTFERLQPSLFEYFCRVLKQDKLGHAYLFAGDFGMMSAAIFLAQSVYCEHKQNKLPCGQCRSCQLVAEDNYVDLHVVQPDGKFIKTDQIRELSEVFFESGFENSKQVVIINEADKLNIQASNALLKVIEEPTSDVLVIFITSNLHLILPTIKSRTQIVHFPSQPELLEQLISHDKLQPSVKRVIVQVAHNLDEAKSLAESKQFSEMVQLIDQFVKLLIAGNKVDAFLKIPVLAKQTDGDKVLQELQLRVLLYRLAEARLVHYAMNAFEAQKFFRANVNSQSCLEYILLGEGNYAL